jgi:hypothetical protein
MKKIITMTLMTLPILFSSNILAEGFNDNYLEVGYSTSDYKFTDTMTSISGSAELGNNYSFSGEYFYEKGDWNDPGEYETSKKTRTILKVAKSFPISEETNITSSFSYEDSENKQVCTNTDGSDCTSSYSDGGTSKLKYSNVSLGIKNLISANSEFHIENTWTRLKSTTDIHYYTSSLELRNISESRIQSSFKYSITSKVDNVRTSQLELGLMKHINDNLAIGARALSHKNADWTEYGIFVRRNF